MYSNKLLYHKFTGYKSSYKIEKAILPGILKVTARSVMSKTTYYMRENNLYNRCTAFESRFTGYSTTIAETLLESLVSGLL